MPYTIAERVQRWTLELNEKVGQETDYNSIYEKIDFLAKRRFFEYVPTGGPYPDFMIRLRNWLDQVPDEKDQKILFQLVLHVFFIGNKEFTSLYRAALRGPIIKWIIDELDLRLDDINLEDKIRQAISETWFCPITDSMQIAGFYHANLIEGIDIRPDWRSLSRLGDKVSISKYMEQKKLKRLVLLEDFVGSGTQMSYPVTFAASLDDNLSILLVPLIICPGGIQKGEELARDNPNVRFSPVLKLPRNVLLSDSPSLGEPELFESARGLCMRLYDLVIGNGNGRGEGNLFGPFGHENTGSLIVMHTNCPDNTLPLIHHQSDTWNPLFPRSRRG